MIAIALSPIIAQAAPGAKLHDIETQLQQRQAQQQDLAKKLSDVKGDLSATQDGLVKMAGSIKSNEQRSTDLDRQIAALAQQNTELTAKLQSDYGSISALVLALERLRRVPPEALIARPGAPLQTAESAILLRDMLPALNMRAEKASAELQDLSRVRQSLEQNRDQAGKTNAALKGQYADMQILADKRKTLFAATENDYQDRQKDIAGLSRQASDLHELMEKLQAKDRRDKERAAKVEQSRAKQSAALKMPAILPHAGIPGLPVIGAVTAAFGEKDAIGAPSEGVRVRARPGAIVTAPMGGIVKFAGLFRAYGQLVIIEHEDDYHSLIGGMGKITVAVGQTVKSGEPLGNMPGNMPLNVSGGASSKDGVTLYYELRRNGRPVDPSTRLKDLRS